MLVGFASSPARARSTSAAAVVVCELRGGTAGSPDTNDTYIRSNARAAAAVVKKAIDQHVTLIEVQFPPVQNMATAALNQLLDANRDITREFVRDFVPTLPSQRLNIVFPDGMYCQFVNSFSCSLGNFCFHVIYIHSKESQCLSICTYESVRVCLC